MVRNLKTVGLTLLAVFATSAFAVPAAQAENPATIIAEQYPVILDGEQEGSLTVLAIVGFRLNVTCQMSTFQGEITESSSGETVGFAQTSYTDCVSGLFTTPVTVTMNGCYYVYHFTADPLDKFTAVTDILCPEGKPMEVHIYGNEGDHESSTALCTYSLGQQSGKTVIELTNKEPDEVTPKDWITVDFNLTGIVITRTGGYGGILACPGTTNGKLQGQATLKGTDEDENDVGITVSTATP